LAAQLVIHMGDRHYDAEIGPQFEQQKEQCHGVRPARHGYGYAVTGFDQLLLANCLQQAPGKIVHGEMVQEPSCQSPMS